MDEIERLIACLKSPDSRVRAEAGIALTELGMKAFPSLARIFQGDDVIAWPESAKAIKNIAEANRGNKELTEALDILIKLLREKRYKTNGWNERIKNILESMDVLSYKTSSSTLQRLHKKTMQALNKNKWNQVPLPFMTSSYQWDVQKKPAYHFMEEVFLSLGDVGKPAIPVLIDILEKNDLELMSLAIEVLGRTKSISAVRALTSVLYDEEFRASALKALNAILSVCDTVEQINEFEKKFDEGLAIQKRRHAQKSSGGKGIELAKMKNEIAKTRDSLASDKGILLDDIPKPPKPGRGIYQAMRVIRNG